MTELIGERQPFVANPIFSRVSTVGLWIASQTPAIDVNEDDGPQAIGVGRNETDCVSRGCRAVVYNRDLAGCHAGELQQLRADPTYQRHLSQRLAVAGGV